MVPLYLAPMHEVNCLGFRLLCKKLGADIVYTPMINTKAYLSNPENFKWVSYEKPLVVQLIGSDKKDFEECVKSINKCEYIDLNAGCPSYDNTKNGMGAALLKNLDNFRAIIKKMAKYSNVPISVKIRLGWKKDESIKIAKIAETSGADRIAIHGRLFGNNYSVPANWKAISKVKKALRIPVIANGDINSPSSAKECLEITNADGLMIGREAMKNPFIFNDIKNYINNNEIKEHSKNERINMILDFIKIYKKNEGYKNADIKTHAIWLCNNFSKSSVIRNNLGKCMDEKSIKNELKKVIGK